MTDRRMREIYIVDLETTGLIGAPMDMILEIGIVKLNLNNGTIEEIYNTVINPGEEALKWYEETNGEPWIFKNAYMTPEEVEDVGIDIADANHDLQEILRNKWVTSYNVPFDFTKFLMEYPYTLYRCNPIIPFDIANLATWTIKAKLCKYDAPHLAICWQENTTPLEKRILQGFCTNPGRRVRAIDAYCYLCPDDPLNLNGKEAHRAFKDAWMEALILRSILMEEEGSL